MLRLAFDCIITWRETRTRPNAYFKNAESYTFNFILALSISFILHEKNSKNKSKRYNE